MNQQNKTSLMLSNLLELTFPLESPDPQNSSKIQNRFLAAEVIDAETFLLRCSLPFTFLVQKIELQHKQDKEEIDQAQMPQLVQDFAESFEVLNINRAFAEVDQSESPIIDFKREKIIWKNKARMRSNSNELHTEDDERKPDPQNSVIKGLVSHLAPPQMNAKRLDSPMTSKHIGFVNEQSPGLNDSLWSDNSEDEADKLGGIQKDISCFIVSGIGNQLSLKIKRTQKQDSTPEDSTMTQEPVVPKELPNLLSHFLGFIKSLKLYLWPTFRVPTAGSSIPLLNVSFLFETHNMQAEQSEANLLVGLSLISGRKFIQASEKIRAIQTSLIIRGQRRDIHCALLLELIVGEAMNKHTQISDKIYSLCRAVDLYKWLNMDQESPSSSRTQAKLLLLNKAHRVKVRQGEVFRSLVQLQPYLARLLIINLESQYEAVRIAVLKTLEFLIETIGCSLESSLVDIMVAIINSYPKLVSIHQQSTHSVNSAVADHSKKYDLQDAIKVPSFFNQSGGSFKQQCTLTQQMLFQRFKQASEEKEREEERQEEPPELNLQPCSSQIFSLLNLHDEHQCQVKDVNDFHASLLQTSRNYYHHILESLLLLLSSMSSNLLQQLFNQVVIRSVFKESSSLGVENSELQIYLLKFADKIVNICRGDIELSAPFLTSLVSTLLEQTDKKGQASAAANEETVSQACSNLWHSIRQLVVVGDFSKRGNKVVTRWLAKELTHLYEQLHGQGQENSQKKRLNMLLDLTELLLEAPSHTPGRNGQPSVTFCTLQHDGMMPQIQIPPLQALCNRDQRVTLNNIETNRKRDSVFYSNRMHQKELTTPEKVFFMELFQLIKPLIQIMQHSIEKQDRLPLFKVTWGTLSRLLTKFPAQMRIETSPITIMMPVFRRVDFFCQQNSPPQEMLTFLTIVFTDVKALLYAQTTQNKPEEFPQVSGKTLKSLGRFLQQFLVNFARVVPHNLHEEVFRVFELLLELLDIYHQTELGVQWVGLPPDHLSIIIEALTHKYTMRSKAHKKLLHYFLSVWILDKSQVAVQRDFREEVQQQQATTNQQVADVQTTRHSGSAENNAQVEPNQVEEDSEAEEINGERERILQVEEPRTEEVLDDDDDVQVEDIFEEDNGSSGSFEQQQETIHQQQQQQVQQTAASVPVTQEQPVRPIPLQQQHSATQNPNFQPHNSMTRSTKSYHSRVSGGFPATIQEERMKQIYQPPTVKPYFDILCEICLSDNQLQLENNERLVSGMIESEDLEHRHLEKITLFLELIQLMQTKHVRLFERLLARPDFSESLTRLFNEPRSNAFAVKILTQLSDFFMQNCAPKCQELHQNLGELPHVIRHNNGPVNPSIHSQMQPITPAHFAQSSHQRHLHSEPSIELYQFMDHAEMVGEDAADLPLEEQQHQQQMLRGLSQERPPQPQMAHHYSSHQQQIYQQMAVPGNEFIEDSPRIFNAVVVDEVQMLNRERLILAQLHATWAKLLIDEIQGHQGQRADSQRQLLALNMLENMFANLLPVPTFQNLVVGKLLQASLTEENQTEQQRNERSANQNASHIRGSSTGNYFGTLSQEARQTVQSSASTGGPGPGTDHVATLLPDLLENLLGSKRPSVSQPDPSWSAAAQQSYLPNAFKCSEPRYLHARLALSMKLLAFVIQTQLGSNWSTIQTRCHAVLGQMVQLGELGQARTSHTGKLKQTLFPLINQLLSSANCERKAIALSILGSLCGLSSFKPRSKKRPLNENPDYGEEEEEWQGSQSNYDAEEMMIYGDGTAGQNLDCQAQFNPNFFTERKICVKEHLQLLRDKANFVSLAIWQQVFELQEHWDSTIHDAAIVLIQLCAPKDSVLHFYKMKQEQRALELNQLYTQFRKQQAELAAILQSPEQQEEQKVCREPDSINIIKPTQQDSDLESNPLDEGESDEFVEVTDECNIPPEKYFFMELASSEHQLRLHLRTFRVDSSTLLKHGSQLWIDKTSSTTHQRTARQLLEVSTGNNDLLVDEMEDNLLEAEFNFLPNDEDQLLEKHVVDPLALSKAPVPSLDFGNMGDGVDDLGIIDLDQFSGSEDDFEEVDDDKLPVLKNTYSKKNRPNNSKSVSVGSRSQGGTIKKRSATFEYKEETKQEDLFFDDEKNQS